MDTTTKQSAPAQNRSTIVPPGRPLDLPRAQPTAAAQPAQAGAPAVSVIIPTYNRATLLSDALDSVAAQTFRDYDIIIVDDGSNDQTRDLVARRKEPIHYHWQPNQGVAEARNHALRITHSEFVAFLDSDDMWEPAFLDRSVTWLREHPEEALVYTDFVSTGPNGKPLRGHRKKPHTGRVTANLFASTFIHTSAVVARAHLIRDAGGFDGRLTHNEDYDLWLRLSLRHRFGLIPEPLCRRRCHPHSLSRDGCRPETLLTKAELLERFYEHGGKDHIPSTIARRRLGKLYYTAGKRFLKARRPHEALPLLRRATHLAPARLRGWFWLFLAGASGLRRPVRHQPAQANR
ncbi:MAG TPA: glycosyltransferase [Phycisphaerae bacterium]|nr:glycosyltransferase [Phycisphaerae bacterium]